MEFPTRGARRHGETSAVDSLFRSDNARTHYISVPGASALGVSECWRQSFSSRFQWLRQPRGQKRDLAGTPLNNNSNPVRSTHETTVSQGATHPASISKAIDHRHHAVLRGACFRSGDRHFSLGERRWRTPTSVHEHDCARAFPRRDCRLRTHLRLRRRRLETRPCRRSLRRRHGHRRRQLHGLALSVRRGPLNLAIRERLWQTQDRSTWCIDHSPRPSPSSGPSENSSFSQCASGRGRFIFSTAFLAGGWVSLSSSSLPPWPPPPARSTSPFSL